MKTYVVRGFDAGRRWHISLLVSPVQQDAKGWKCSGGTGPGARTQANSANVYGDNTESGGTGSRTCFINDQMPVLINILFQNFLHSSHLAIFQPDFDTPVMFCATCQDILDHPFCQHP